MKIKELKNLAAKIAQLEIKLRSAKNEDERDRLEDEIDILCSHAADIDTMIQLDDMVQEILAKQEKNIS